mmetsp:Transcript_38726/g.28612  ORF Transcript_38726/g.28612 Transcript_38726/m.28612 type:complete len:104 (+) Transcript_38726:616-927(+)
MRRDTTSNHVELWNPMNGEAYFFGKEDQLDQRRCCKIGSGQRMNIRLNDPTCQMKQLGCVVGQDNIWANIQEFDDPALLDFNLDEKKKWQALFNPQTFQKYFP